jgi:hypothetical protein
MSFKIWSELKKQSSIYHLNVDSKYIFFYRVLSISRMIFMRSEKKTRFGKNRKITLFSIFSERKNWNVKIYTYIESAR